MKIHEEHKFQIVLIIRIDEMRIDHSFGNRSPIQLYLVAAFLIHLNTHENTHLSAFFLT